LVTDEIGPKESDVAAPKSVEDYLAALPDGPRAALEKLRATIKAAAPDATESISYQMPTLKLRGRFLVSYAAFKEHYSLFPASEAVMQALGDELKPRLSGKATIRFRGNEPIPVALVKKIVEVRIEETNAAQDRS
jgi:uncharacterized protein YdhG (YjbR/CyaY superfamily)